jgi:hypothetical protein
MMGWSAGYGATCGRAGRPASMLRGAARSLGFSKVDGAVLIVSNPWAMSSHKQC